LADFSEIGSREAVGDVADEVEIDVASDGSLPQVGLENAETGGLVGEGNVDELVAPMMKMFFLAPTPSISVSSWLMTLSPAPPASPCPPPLATAMESN
jgi:hypothetical protein